MFGALHRRHRRRAARRLRASPRRAQGRRRRLHDGASQIPMAAAQGRRRSASSPASQIFLKRAGTIILGTTIILWALASIPQAGPGQKQSEVSIAGHIADGHRDRRSADRLQPRHRAGACCRRWRRARSRSARSPPSIRSIAGRRCGGERTLDRQAAAPLVAGDRARLPRLVRVRAAVHLDHRRHPARDQRLEVAAVHGRLPVRPRLYRCRR